MGRPQAAHGRAKPALTLTEQSSRWSVPPQTPPSILSKSGSADGKPAANPGTQRCKKCVRYCEPGSLARAAGIGAEGAWTPPERPPGDDDAVGTGEPFRAESSLTPGTSQTPEPRSSRQRRGRGGRRARPGRSPGRAARRGWAGELAVLRQRERSERSPDHPAPAKIVESCSVRTWSVRKCRFSGGEQVGIGRRP